ncbi:PREDICTED: titin-like [Priapulus caudatus]|uniref:Titin-like n=1 Tax=Priapulus caudatus TaxID=37621 RepID=A0ABM1E7Y6_PRICU|nr:PREDICTED: titin-like [Priapulus caudatus]
MALCLVQISPRCRSSSAGIVEELQGYEDRPLPLGEAVARLADLVTEWKYKKVSIDQLRETSDHLLETFNCDCTPRLEVALLNDRYLVLNEYVQGQLSRANGLYKSLEETLTHCDTYLTEMATSVASGHPVVARNAEEVQELLLKTQKMLEEVGDKSAILQEEVKQTGELGECPLKELDTHVQQKFDRVIAMIEERLVTIRKAFMEWADYQKMKSDVETVIRPAALALKEVQQVPVQRDDDVLQSNIDKVTTMKEDLEDVSQLFSELQRIYSALCPGVDADEDSDFQQLHNDYTELSEQVATLLEIYLRCQTLSAEYTELLATIETQLEDYEKQLFTLKHDTEMTPQDKIKDVEILHEAVKELKPSLARLRKLVSSELAPLLCESDEAELTQSVSGVEQKWTDLLQDTRTCADHLKSQASSNELLAALLCKEQTWIEQITETLTNPVEVSLQPNAAKKALREFESMCISVDAHMVEYKTQLTEQLSEMEKSGKEVVPEFQHQVEENAAGHDSVKALLEERRTTLQAAKVDRAAYSKDDDNVTTWLTKAEDILSPPSEGVSGEALPSQIQNVQVFLSTATSPQTSLKQMTALVEKMAPTMNADDSLDIANHVSQLILKLNVTLEQTVTYQETLGKQYATWQQYLTHVKESSLMLDAMEHKMKQLKEAKPLTATAIEERLQKNQEFTCELEQKNSLVDDVALSARAVERHSDSETRLQVERTVTVITERWQLINQEVESQEAALRQMIGSWETYNEAVSSLTTKLDFTESKVPVSEVEVFSRDELQFEISATEELLLEVEQVMIDLDGMRTTGKSLIALLPAKEVQSPIIDEIKGEEERCARLEETVSEIFFRLHQEVSMRDSFHSEVTVSFTALQDAEVKLDNLTEMTTDDERVEAQKIIREEVTVHVTRVETSVVRYMQTHDELPEETSKLLSEFDSKKDAVIAKLDAAEQELNAVRTLRVVYRTMVQHIITHIHTIITRIRTTVITTTTFNVAQQQQQAIVQELDECKAEIEEARKEAEALCQVTSDPEEVKDILNKIAELNEQWLEVQTLVNQSSQQLGEATELWFCYEDSRTFVTEWVAGTENAIAIQQASGSTEPIDVQVNELEGFMNDFVQVHHHISLMEDTLEQLEQVQIPVDQEKPIVAALSSTVNQLEEVVKGRVNALKIEQDEERVRLSQLTTVTTTTVVTTVTTKPEVDVLESPSAMEEMPSPSDETSQQALPQEAAQAVLSPDEATEDTGYYSVEDLRQVVSPTSPKARETAVVTVADVLAVEKAKERPEATAEEALIAFEDEEAASWSETVVETTTETTTETATTIVKEQVYTEVDDESTEFVIIEKEEVDTGVSHVGEEIETSEQKEVREEEAPAMQEDEQEKEAFVLVDEEEAEAQPEHPPLAEDEVGPAKKSKRKRKPKKKKKKHPSDPHEVVAADEVEEVAEDGMVGEEHAKSEPVDEMDVINVAAQKEDIEETSVTITEKAVIEDVRVDEELPEGVEKTGEEEGEDEEVHGKKKKKRKPRKKKKKSLSEPAEAEPEVAASTREVITESITTEVVTTKVITSDTITEEDTTGELAENAITTEVVTAENDTAEPVSIEVATTEEVATEPTTTDVVTTEIVTTKHITTEIITTEEITTEPVTTEEITTEPVTTEALTTEEVATEPVTTEALTTEEVATEPVTAEVITTEEVTTEDFTDEPSLPTESPIDFTTEEAEVSSPHTVEDESTDVYDEAPGRKKRKRKPRRKKKAGVVVEQPGESTEDTKDDQYFVTEPDDDVDTRDEAEKRVTEVTTIKKTVITEELREITGERVLVTTDEAEFKDIPQSLSEEDIVVCEEVTDVDADQLLPEFTTAHQKLKEPSESQELHLDEVTKGTQKIENVKYAVEETQMDADPTTTTTTTTTTTSATETTKIQIEHQLIDSVLVGDSSEICIGNENVVETTNITSQIERESVIEAFEHRTAEIEIPTERERQFELLSSTTDVGKNKKLEGSDLSSEKLAASQKLAGHTEERRISEYDDVSIPDIYDDWGVLPEEKCTEIVEVVNQMGSGGEPADVSDAEIDLKTDDPSWVAISNVQFGLDKQAVVTEMRTELEDQSVALYSDEVIPEIYDDWGLGEDQAYRISTAITGDRVDVTTELTLSHEEVETPNEPTELEISKIEVKTDRPTGLRAAEADVEYQEAPRVLPTPEEELVKLEEHTEVLIAEVEVETSEEPSELLIAEVEVETPEEKIEEPSELLIAEVEVETPEEKIEEPSELLIAEVEVETSEEKTEAPTELVAEVEVETPEEKPEEPTELLAYEEEIKPTESSEVLPTEVGEDKQEEPSDLLMAAVKNQTELTKAEEELEKSDVSIDRATTAKEVETPEDLAHGAAAEIDLSTIDPQMVAIPNAEFGLDKHAVVTEMRTEPEDQFVALYRDEVIPEIYEDWGLGDDQAYETATEILYPMGFLERVDETTELRIAEVEVERPEEKTEEPSELLIAEVEVEMPEEKTEEPSELVIAEVEVETSEKKTEEPSELVIAEVEVETSAEKPEEPAELVIAEVEVETPEEKIEEPSELVIAEVEVETPEEKTEEPSELLIAEVEVESPEEKTEEPSELLLAEVEVETPEEKTEEHTELLIAEVEVETPEEKTEEHTELLIAEVEVETPEEKTEAPTERLIAEVEVETQEEPTELLDYEEEMKPTESSEMLAADVGEDKPIKLIEHTTTEEEVAVTDLPSEWPTTVKGEKPVDTTEPPASDDKILIEERPIKAADIPAPDAEVKQCEPPEVTPAELEENPPESTKIPILDVELERPNDTIEVTMSAIVERHKESRETLADAIEVKPDMPTEPSTAEVDEKPEQHIDTTRNEDVCVEILYRESDDSIETITTTLTTTTTTRTESLETDISGPENTLQQDTEYPQTSGPVSIVEIVAEELENSGTTSVTKITKTLISRETVDVTDSCPAAQGVSCYEQGVDVMTEYIQTDSRLQEADVAAIRHELEKTSDVTVKHETFEQNLGLGLPLADVSRETDYATEVTSHEAEDSTETTTTTLITTVATTRTIESIEVEPDNISSNEIIATATEPHQSTLIVDSHETEDESGTLTSVTKLTKTVITTRVEDVTDLTAELEEKGANVLFDVNKSVDMLKMEERRTEVTLDRQPTEPTVASEREGAGEIKWAVITEPNLDKEGDDTVSQEQETKPDSDAEFLPKTEMISSAVQVTTRITETTETSIGDADLSQLMTPSTTVSSMLTQHHVDTIVKLETVEEAEADDVTHVQFHKLDLHEEMNTADVELEMAEPLTEVQTPEQPSEVEIAEVEIEKPAEPTEISTAEVEFEKPEHPSEVETAEALIEKPEEPTEISTAEVEFEEQEQPSDVETAEIEIEKPAEPTEISTAEVEFEIPEQPSEIQIAEVEIEKPAEPTEISTAELEFEEQAQPSPEATAEASIGKSEEPTEISTAEVEIEKKEQPSEVESVEVEFEKPPAPTEFSTVKVEFEKPQQPSEVATADIEIEKPAESTEISTAEVEFEKPEKLDEQTAAETAEFIHEELEEPAALLDVPGDMEEVTTEEEVDHAENGHEPGKRKRKRKRKPRGRRQKKHPDEDDGMAGEVSLVVSDMASHEVDKTRDITDIGPSDEVQETQEVIIAESMHEKAHEPTEISIAEVEFEIPGQPSEVKAAEIEIEKPVQPTEISMAEVEVEIPEHPSEVETAEVEIDKLAEPTEISTAEVEFEKPQQPSDVESAEIEIEKPEEPTDISTAEVACEIPEKLDEQTAAETAEFIPEESEEPAALLDVPDDIEQVTTEEEVDHAENGHEPGKRKRKRKRKPRGRRKKHLDEEDSMAGEVSIVVSDMVSHEAAISTAEDEVKKKEQPSQVATAEAEMEKPSEPSDISTAEDEFEKSEQPSEVLVAEVEVEKPSEPTEISTAEIQFEKPEQPSEVATAEVEMKKPSEPSEISTAEIQFEKSEQPSEVLIAEVEVEKPSEPTEISTAEVEIEKPEELASVPTGEIEVKKSEELAEVPTAEIEAKKSQEPAAVPTAEIEIRKPDEPFEVPMAAAEVQELDQSTEQHEGDVEKPSEPAQLVMADIEVRREEQVEVLTADIEVAKPEMSVELADIVEEVRPDSATELPTSEEEERPDQVTEQLTADRDRKPEEPTDLATTLLTVISEQTISVEEVGTAQPPFITTAEAQVKANGAMPSVVSHLEEVSQDLMKPEHSQEVTTLDVEVEESQVGEQHVQASDVNLARKVQPVEECLSLAGATEEPITEQVGYSKLERVLEELALLEEAVRKGEEAAEVILEELSVEDHSICLDRTVSSAIDELQADDSIVDDLTDIDDAMVIESDDVLENLALDIDRDVSREMDIQTHVSADEHDSQLERVAESKELVLEPSLITVVETDGKLLKVAADEKVLDDSTVLADALQNKSEDSLILSEMEFANDSRDMATRSISPVVLTIPVQNEGMGEETTYKVKKKKKRKETKRSMPMSSDVQAVTSIYLSVSLDVSLESGDTSKEILYEVPQLEVPEMPTSTTTERTIDVATPVQEQEEIITFLNIPANFEDVTRDVVFAVPHPAEKKKKKKKQKPVAKSLETTDLATALSAVCLDALLETASTRKEIVFEASQHVIKEEDTPVAESTTQDITPSDQVMEVTIATLHIMADREDLPKHAVFEASLATKKKTKKKKRVKEPALVTHSEGSVDSGTPPSVCLDVPFDQGDIHKETFEVSQLIPKEEAKSMPEEPAMEAVILSSEVGEGAVETLNIMADNEDLPKHLLFKVSAPMEKKGKKEKRSADVTQPFESTESATDHPICLDVALESDDTSNETIFEISCQDSSVEIAPTSRQETDQSLNLYLTEKSEQVLSLRTKQQVMAVEELASIESKREQRVSVEQMSTEYEHAEGPGIHSVEVLIEDESSEEMEYSCNTAAFRRQERSRLRAQQEKFTQQWQQSERSEVKLQTESQMSENLFSRLAKQKAYTTSRSTEAVGDDSSSEEEQLSIKHQLSLARRQQSNVHKEQQERETMSTSQIQASTASTRYSSRTGVSSRRVITSDSMSDTPQERITRERISRARAAAYEANKQLHQLALSQQQQHQQQPADQSTVQYIRHGSDIVAASRDEHLKATPASHFIKRSATSTYSSHRTTSLMQAGQFVTSRSSSSALTPHKRRARVHKSLVKAVSDDGSYQLVRRNLSIQEHQTIGGIRGPLIQHIEVIIEEDSDAEQEDVQAAIHEQYGHKIVSIHMAKKLNFNSWQVMEYYKVVPQLVRPVVEELDVLIDTDSEKKSDDEVAHPTFTYTTKH